MGLWLVILSKCYQWQEYLRGLPSTEKTADGFEDQGLQVESEAYRKKGDLCY